MFEFKFSNNNSRIKCEICSEVLVSLLLTLNIFNKFLVLFIYFFAEFEHVNAGWNTFLL